MQNTLSLARKRIVFLIFLIVVGVCLVSARLFDLMIIRGFEFRKTADENRFFIKSVLPHRGVFFDRNGVQLTRNSVRYSVLHIISNKRTLQPISDDQAVRVAATESSALYHTFSRDDLFLPALSHVLGYIGFADPQTEEYITSLDEKFGKAGLERSQNDILRGSSGQQTYEIQASGRFTRLIQEIQSRPGSDMTLTIGSALSVRTYQALEGKQGAVVVLEPKTGDVLALVSSPGYEPAQFASSLTDERKPLINRALYPYPPGSTFKLITALSALSAGAIDQYTSIEDKGEIKAGQQIFGNWYFRQYGRTEGIVNLHRALVRSNDIYFYTVAEKIGPTVIGEMALRFGLGKRTGIELIEDHAGFIPNPAWKEKTTGSKWFLGDTYNMGIGQGYVLLTPLQVAQMTGTLSLKGTICTPTLLLSSSPSCADLGVSRQQVDFIIDGMVAACSQGGTGFPFFTLNESLPDEKKIACKTGTAEFGVSDTAGHKKTHGWFTLLYPHNDPLVAITVFIESTKEQPFVEGSADAGPVARKVFEEWKKIYDQ